MDNYCDLHPEGRIIPGHDRFKCLECNKYYDNEIAKYDKYKQDKKKQRRKRK